MNVVTVKVAPAGRLPVTRYPANYVRRAAMTDMSSRPNQTLRNPVRTYKWFNGAVQEFGHGLHYTEFSLGVGKKVKKSYDIAELLEGMVRSIKIFTRLRCLRLVSRIGGMWCRISLRWGFFQENMDQCLIRLNNL